MDKEKEKLLNILNNEDYGLFPAPLDSDTALQILRSYLLGEDWYTIMPMSQEQINTIMVYEILEKYSRQFKKDVKKYRLYKLHKKE